MDNLGGLIKEVYACFGLAYYLGEVLHRALCNVYVLLTFESPKGMTRARVEEKYSYVFSLTLGQTMKEVEHLLGPQLKEELQQALDKRNFLAHSFWFDRIHLMSNEQGLLEMLKELEGFTQLFVELDEKINKHLECRRNELGLTDEILQYLMNDLASGNVGEPLMSQRSLKKQERVIRVWNAKTDDNLITQVFEMEDGTLWQLCDVGLGWSRFEQPSPDWLENQDIKTFYLLTSILGPLFLSPGIMSSS